MTIRDNRCMQLSSVLLSCSDLSSAAFRRPHRATVELLLSYCRATVELDIVWATVGQDLGSDSGQRTADSGQQTAGSVRDE